MRNKVLIKEIFKSIQGEGLYIGTNQLFIRFSHCNLHCEYCDTDFITDLKEYNATELSSFVNNIKDIHSISLTGGEPLMEADFLTEFLPLVNHKIYLETNGTLFFDLKKIINYVDIIAMDIKLESSSKNGDLFDIHEKFINTAKEKELFVKVVFDENIKEEEIIKCTALTKKYSVPLIIQPKMNGENLELRTDFINKVFYRFINLYSQTRLIPQVHKFMNIR